ncbi:MAG: hypothetical protein ACLPN2_10420 [Terriglobales bacterium]
MWPKGALFLCLSFLLLPLLAQKPPETYQEDDLISSLRMAGVL